MRVKLPKGKGVSREVRKRSKRWLNKQVITGGKGGTTDLMQDYTDTVVGKGGMVRFVTGYYTIPALLISLGVLGSSLALFFVGIAYYSVGIAGFQVIGVILMCLSGVTVACSTAVLTVYSYLHPVAIFMVNVIISMIARSMGLFIWLVLAQIIIKLVGYYGIKWRQDKHKRVDK